MTLGGALALGGVLALGAVGCSKSAPTGPGAEPSAAPASASASTGQAGRTAAPARPTTGTATRDDAAHGPAAGVAGPGEMRRHERAGIELAPSPPPTRGATGPAADRPPPAPPLLAGPKVAKARAAWAFVQGPWRAAVRSGEAQRYGALLRARDVNAVQERPDGTKILTRPTLLAFLQGAWKGQEGTVEVAAPEIEPTLGPEGEVQVRFFERQVRAGRCETAWRMLQLVEAEGGGYRVATDQRLAVRACPADPKARAKADHDQAVGLAAAHEDLVRTLAGPDDASKEQVAQEVLVLDVGIARERFGWTQLAPDGPGAWVRARATEVEAELDNTGTLGRVGWVRHASGDTLIYRKVTRAPGDDLWVWYALLRGM